MFTIYKSQMEELSLHMQKSFMEQADSHLRRKFPIRLKEMGDATAREFILNGSRKAAKYNITNRLDVILFSELLLGLGEDFDTNPPVEIIKRYLNTINFSGTQKIRKIFKLNLI